MRWRVPAIPGIRFATVAGTILVVAVAGQTLPGVTPTLAQQSLPDCDSAGASAECRTEWSENRDSSGLGYRLQRTGKSTFVATGNVGSAESPANVADATIVGKQFYGGYAINVSSTDIRETVLINSAGIYLNSTTDTPNGALAIGYSAGVGAKTRITNEQGGFLKADNGIWAGWRSGLRDRKLSEYDNLFEITERGTITSDATGIEAIGGDGAVVTVESGGRITAGGDGIRRTGRGGGTVTVLDGATITAATAANSDKWGVDIAVDAEPNNPDRELSMDQKSATVDVSGVIDSRHGGVRVENNGPGPTRVTVTESGSVTGDQYGILVSGSGINTVTVEVSGMVSGAGMDAIRADASGNLQVRLMNDFRIAGGIRFDGNGSNDLLGLVVAEDMYGEMTGDIQGASGIVKTGEGTARLAGDASLVAGSTFRIDGGNLILHGHVNLGTGTFTVADGERLTIEVGPGPDTNDHGRVTADTITIPVGTPVHVALVDDARAAAVERLKGGITVFAGDGAAGMEGVVALVFDRYSSVTGKTVGMNGIIQEDLTAVNPDPEPGSGGNGGGGGSGSGGAALLVVGGGALAYLLWDLGLFGEEALSGIRSNARGLEYQVRSLDRTAVSAAGAILPATGVTTSLRAHLGDGFHVDLTGTPDFAASFEQDTLSGRRYGLGLGWQAGAFSTDIGYSNATLDNRSTFSNLAGFGMLSGSHNQRHDQLRANARLRLDTAGLLLAPSLSLYGGTVSDEGYTATSPVWLSEVPPVMQDYSGWKAGMTMAPRSGLEAMGLRWRPELHLTTARLADGGGEDLEVVQRDRAGALRLQTKARATLPRAVHALGGGLTVADGENWSLRGGYVAMLADGNLEQAAVAGFRMRI